MRTFRWLQGLGPAHLEWQSCHLLKWGKLWWGRWSHVSDIKWRYWADGQIHKSGLWQRNWAGDLNVKVKVRKQSETTQGGNLIEIQEWGLELQYKEVEEKGASKRGYQERKVSWQPRGKQASRRRELLLGWQWSGKTRAENWSWILPFLRVSVRVKVQLEWVQWDRQES